jgi:predicted RNase H-like HicB family nuclease
MKHRWIEKKGEIIDLPNLSAVIEKDGSWFVSKCPELGVASQGKTRNEAYDMLSEAVALWLSVASAREIKRKLRTGARVKSLDLAHA